MNGWIEPKVMVAASCTNSRKEVDGGRFGNSSDSLLSKSALPVLGEFDGKAEVN